MMGRVTEIYLRLSPTRSTNVVRRVSAAAPILRYPKRLGWSLSPGPPAAVSKTISWRSSPETESVVALSKSIIKSKRPEDLRYSLKASRRLACSADPYAASGLPRAEVTVPPITLASGRRDLIRPTASFTLDVTVSIEKKLLLLRSLVPSSQITAEIPDRASLVNNQGAQRFDFRQYLR